MRNPDRIIPFLKLVEEAWMKNPDLRFGQLIYNIDESDPNIGNHLFYIEDPDMEELILRYLHGI